MRKARERDFLSSPHTLAHMREMSQSELFDRDSSDTQIKTDEKDVIVRAYEKAREILANHIPKPLPEDAAESMRSIIEDYEAELGVKK